MLVFTKALCSRGLVGLPISRVRNLLHAGLDNISLADCLQCEGLTCKKRSVVSQTHHRILRETVDLLGVLFSFRVISFWFMRSNMKTLPSAACLLVFPQFHSAKTTTAQQANAFEFASLDLGSILGQTSMAHGAASI